MVPQVSSEEVESIQCKKMKSTLYLSKLQLIINSFINVKKCSCPLCTIKNIFYGWLT